MFGILASVLIAFLSLFVPGVLLAAVLLRKTELHSFEIIVIGFIFGLIAPATMTWAESYLVNYVHFFTFSLALFEINALILTIIGLILAYRDGVLVDFVNWVRSIMGASLAAGAGTQKQLDAVRVELSKYDRGREVISKHNEEEHALLARQSAEMSSATFKADEKQIMEYNHKDARLRLLKGQLSEERSLAETMEGPRSTITKPTWIIWVILLGLMLLTFYTRMLSIPTAPSFFEFDPYFDMIDTHYILTYGHQLLLDPSAWPVIAAGTNHRIEPIVPYLEAYWYSLVNSIKFHYSLFNTTLMSYVGSIYPPITAALLVFIVFVLLYHEYDAKIALIGAGLTTAMPTLLSTFIAGEQLVEPWGIMALFFFIMAYMLVVRNPKNKRLAILAGLAFVSSFLGAHYYTVTTGVFAAYIFVQGTIDLVKGSKELKDFYISNAIILGIIAIFLVIFLPYQSTLQNRIPSILGIPFTLSAPLFALLAIFVIDLILKQFNKRKIVVTENNWMKRFGLVVALYVVMLVLVLVSPIHKSLNNYINLSSHFTTPSIPLFMTVQEYIPTGLFYNFDANGFGPIGAPYFLLFVMAVSMALIIISILFRNSKTGTLYLAISLPLMVAGFSEVKYLPHLGVAYIILFCILLGELLYFVQSNWKLSEYKKYNAINPSTYVTKSGVAWMILFVGLFFVLGLLSLVVIGILFLLSYTKNIDLPLPKNIPFAALVIVLMIIAVIYAPLRFGESGTIIEALQASFVYSANPSTACTTLSNNGNGVGVSLYCNTIPAYWLNAMSWLKTNVGPEAPRVLAWWDYGDWINWFGNSNAVLRGDNAVASEDYAVAAQYVLGPKYNATPQSLENMMETNQTKYVLFDQDLIQKWGALDFLGCVNDNGTSLQYAVQAGKASSPAEPYALGTSDCEQTHDPQYAAVPLAVFQGGSSSASSINDYCSINNSSAIYASTYLITGSSISNTSGCLQIPSAATAASNRGVLQLYTTSGTQLNAIIQESQYLGVQDIQGVPYILFLVIYTPNGPNDTITNAPSDFYDSNYYKGFFLGDLPGFKEVYPANDSIGVNFVNFTSPVRIYEIVNYTGGAPAVPAKPSYVTNNDVMP